MKEKDLIASAEKMGLLAWFDKNLSLWGVALDDIPIYLTPKELEEITKKEFVVIVTKTFLEMMYSGEERTIIFH